MLGASHVPPDGKGAMEPGFGTLAVLAFILASIAPMTVAAGVIPTAYAVTGLTGIPPRSPSWPSSWPCSAPAIPSGPQRRVRRVEEAPLLQPAVQRCGRRVVAACVVPAGFLAPPSRRAGVDSAGT